MKASAKACSHSMGMRSLSKADLFNAAEVIGSVFEATTISEFANRLCEALPQVIESEFVSYNELDAVNSRAIIIMEPHSDSVIQNQSAFEQTVSTHPYMRHFQKYGDSRALRISDVSTARQFRETPVYREFYRLISVKDQMVTFIASTSCLHIGIALTRTSAGFSSRDRDLFEFLRPHLLRGYKSVRRVSELVQQRLALQKALETRNAAVAFCLQNGELTFISPRAEELVRKWFSISQFRMTRLPDELVGSATHEAAALAKSQFSRHGSLLIVSSFPENQQICFLFSEVEDPLGGWGLSPREVEVLKWVAEGKRNDEIGTILGISGATVKRHVDHILEKLHVETRTAAAMTFHRATAH